MGGKRWATPSRLVMASIQAWPDQVPTRRPAYDVIAQAMGGIMSLTGHRARSDQGRHLDRRHRPVCSPRPGSWLRSPRERSGRGARVDVSMLDAQVATLENAIVRYLVTGEVPGPLGSRHPSIAPFQALATGDGFIVVAAGNDALFANLCRSVERPELAQEAEFATNELRTRHADSLARRLEEALACHGSAWWLAKLQAAGVPFGPVNDIAQLVADPQIAARNLLVSVEGLGLRVAGNPVKLSGFADPGCAPPARAGRGPRADPGGAGDGGSRLTRPPGFGGARLSPGAPRARP
jgi:CoA:oxalate CoA-transferase